VREDTQNTVMGRVNMNTRKALMVEDRRIEEAVTRLPTMTITQTPKMNNCCSNRLSPHVTGRRNDAGQIYHGIGRKVACQDMHNIIFPRPCNILFIILQCTQYPIQLNVIYSHISEEM
jgi:hypothetical protein